VKPPSKTRSQKAVPLSRIENQESKGNARVESEKDEEKPPRRRGVIAICKNGLRLAVGSHPRIAHGRLAGIEATGADPLEAVARVLLFSAVGGTTEPRGGRHGGREEDMWIWHRRT
jgi:hypothetical protein